MRKVLVIMLIGAILLASFPGAALAGGRWHGGHFGGHGGWWVPGAIIGGVALGLAAIVTAPFWAVSAPRAYSPPVVYAPPPVTYAPPPAYSAPPTYPPPSTYAPPPAYQSGPSYAAPQAAPVQREVVYSNGRYVLYGDGVRQPWQWVWVPLASPPPPPAAPPPAP